MDYWITAGDTPDQIESQYAQVTGTVPMMPSFGRRAHLAEQLPERSYDAECSLPDYLAEVEIRIIREAIINAEGNISKAAETLQIKRQTLQHKLKKYHISVL